MNNFHKLVLTVLAVALALSTAQFNVVQGSENVRAGSIQVKHFPQEFPELAKITPHEAVKIALKQAKGGILEVELENEDGYLVWDVEVATEDGAIKEYAIDAGNGKILGVSVEEDDEDEEKEKEKEKGEDDEDEEKIEQGSVKVEHSPSEYPGLAKISAVEAIDIALGLVKGKLFALELDEDDGYLIYEMIVIGANGAVKEIELDAGTGEIIEIEEYEHDDD